MKDPKTPTPAVLEASLAELELAAGGASQAFFSTVSPGLTPSHNYGVASDTFGHNMSFQQANDLVQRFNAPTADALYNGGNDPAAESGTVSRPGAAWLPQPLDHGGNVTLEHGDGYAKNTTIDYQHPLQGTITRNLVVDLNDGGGYQVLTMGRGEGGAQLATIAGQTIAGPLGGLIAQNGSHIVNPELGRQAFSQLDAAMIANANGTPNPNLQAPQGPLTEAGGLFSAMVEGGKAIIGLGPTAPAGTDKQTQLVYDVAKDVNQSGPVEGYFMKSSVTDGVYHQTPEGTKYYERGEDGKPVLKQVDEFAGVDQAIAKQAALEAARNEAGTTMPDVDSKIPTPPTDLPPLPEELQPKETAPETTPENADPGTNMPDGVTPETAAPSDTPADVEPVNEPATVEPTELTADPATVEPSSEPLTADPTLDPTIEPATIDPIDPTTEPATLEPAYEPTVDTPTFETPTIEPAYQPTLDTPTIDTPTYETYEPAYDPMSTYDPMSAYDPYQSSFGVGDTLSTSGYDSTPWNTLDNSSTYTYQSPLDTYAGLESTYSPSYDSYDSYNSDTFSGTSFDTSSSGFDSSYSSGSFDSSSSYSSSYSSTGYGGDSGGGGGGGGGGE